VLATATPNALPLQPEITPGFSVAGILLILSGVAYTLVGIKNKWLHIYFSAAYLASLAVTVLILYVMNPPVNNAIQGAYVVAIAMTGLILGGAAIVFTEMTEGLGCLLGGFCFSMWLLVLKPGGLLTSTSGKSIFIAAFTLAAFSTSFTRYTRPYGLIIFVSFGGATATVLGIDCFSRAGLKEYWAYLWDLNSNLFPLGATSYPLTRGIRVEIAAMVIIFLAGILSQSKLWKLIKERREQRAAERLQDERNLEKEEENVGKRIEETTAADRSQWEATYGSKDAVKATPRDSGVGDMDSQKKGAMSEVTSIRRSGDEEIEMSEMSSPPLVNGPGLVMMNSGQHGGPVTVRVARDVEPPLELDENGNPIERPAKRNSQISARGETIEEEQVWIVGADGEARLKRRPSKRNSKRRSNPIPTKSPDVVALPFKVPEGEVVEDDRSSVATFADEEQAGQKRLSKRLSQVLMRKLSHRSQRSQRNSKHFSIGEGQSTEDLVIPRAIEEDRRSSLAATMDGLSDGEDMRSVRSSRLHVPENRESTGPPEESTAPDFAANQPGPTPMSNPTATLAVANAGEKSRPISTATVATAILEQEAAGQKPEAAEAKTGEALVQKSLTLSMDPKPEPAVEKQSSEEEKDEPAPSVVAQVESKPASLSKDRLPPQLSRVVMSYRTNEWAKHLSNADAPEVDELKLEEHPTERPETVQEVAAPVNVEELQQTAENAMPLPAPVSRTVSQLSNHAPARSNSVQSKYPFPEQPSNFQNQDIHSQNPSIQSLPSLLSQQALGRSLGYRSSSSPAIPQQIVESPIEENFPPTTPNPSSSKFSPATVPYGSTSTLIGRRDTMLRGKYAYYSNPSAPSSTPELLSQNPYLQFPAQYNSGPTSHNGSDAGSIYNHSTPIPDDDNISLSARRNLIRQSSLQQLSSPIAPQYQQGPIPFDSHQPRRQCGVPAPSAREQQLASWRASVQHDLQSGIVPKNTIERQRSALWQERQAEDQRKALEERMRNQRDSAFDERMRRGDMLDAHREALRKMQAKANRASQAQS
jgi:hypothetical protein